jgi:(E)-4-hydroxy-3-methylbut-2-enyl-diphosphate synthase
VSGNIGGKNVPVVIADFESAGKITTASIEGIGYRYDAELDKWNISDGAADFIFTGNQKIDFALPGTLKVICPFIFWKEMPDKTKYLPLFQTAEYLEQTTSPHSTHFVLFDTAQTGLWDLMINAVLQNNEAILCLESSHFHAMPCVRRFIARLIEMKAICPVILRVESSNESIDEQLIHFSTEAGALFLEGMGDGIWLWNRRKQLQNSRVSGRTYLEVKNNQQFLNNTAFSILQATRTRISKTEYISCPSCGRTLFDLQETTARIRAVTHHLKGIKIAIMGCIVNGPGEMADADFGYVGSGPGKITLYKGKEIVKRNVDSNIAVEELIAILRENEAWVEPETINKK